MDLSQSIGMRTERIVPIFNVADLYSFHGDLPSDLNARDLVQTPHGENKVFDKVIEVREIKIRGGSYFQFLAK